MTHQPTTPRTHSAVFLFIATPFGVDVWELARTTPCGLCRDTHAVTVLRTDDEPGHPYPRIEPRPNGWPVNLPCPACRTADFLTHPAVRRHGYEY